MKNFKYSLLKYSILIYSLLNYSQLTFSQSFDQFFFNKTMRVDYYHTGTKGTETISLDKVYEEGPWAGSTQNLVDVLNMGEYMVRVFDAATTQMIFSRGYSSVFQEWQTTDEALAGIYKTFHESVRLPFPKNKIQLVICRRDKKMGFHEIFSTVIDPNDPTQVNREKKPVAYKVVPLMKSGDSHEKVDKVIVGDGYRKEDMEKFRKDAKHFNDVMFSTSPFKERKKDFNVWTIEVASQDSGIDKPDKNIWKNTALGAMYNTFGSPRYILTEDNKSLRDICAAAPYDFVNILINDNRYGGGGIYNLYTTTFTRGDAPGMDWQMDYVYVHEFGHSFGGLGDEYYSSQVSYVDMYQKGVEPWEPNLTALVDKKNLKWKYLMEEGTPLPTPWEKSQYDSLGRLRAKLDRLAPDYYEKRKPLYDAEQNILKTTKYAGKVGAFEGAGYVSEGIYRPSVDCRMFSLSLVGFDPVCTAAINRVIDFYTK
ncbi:MAG: M64 family metallopeptidase [Bacteroidota bacterium]|nr:M64 family metallopeptidase [Bacteroidota bacterium]